MKKVLSLVLSLCLFVSLGAGISVDTAKAAATDLEYWFDVAGKYNGAVDYSYISTLTYDAVNALDTNNKSDDWAFHSTKVPSGDAVCGAGNDYITYLGNGSAITINSYSRKEDYLLRLQFKVPNAGKYVPFVNFDGYNAANGHNIPFAIYAVNGDGTLGTQVFDTKWIHSNSQHSHSHYVALSDTGIDFAAGTYAIEWGTVQTKAQVRVRGLKLAAADSAIPTALTLDKGQNYFEVNAGQKIQLPLSVKMSDGTTGTLNLNGWTYTQDSTSVHTRLNKENGTLDITGLAENNTPETFEYKIGNAMVRFNVKVNAADYLAPDKNLNYNFLAVMASEAQCNGGNTLLYGSVATTYALPLYGKAYGAAYSLKPGSEPWKILAKRDTSGNAKPNLYFNAFMAVANYGIYFYDAGSADLGILVANDGKYIPSITLGAAAPAADMTVTLKKMDGTTLATTTVAKNTVANSTINLTSTPVEMKAGEYMVTFSKATASAMVYMNSFDLAYNSGLTYNVTLNAGEGTAASDVTSYTHGTAVTLPAVTAPEGYTFAGWYDANDKVVTEIKALDRGDKVYTAKYNEIPKVYTVTLNANGGTLASNLTEYTGGVGATLPTATKDGYVFAGWYDNADCIGTAVEAIGTDATGDKTFYAKWTLDVAASDFEVTSDSGYYAPYITNPYREGVIAVSAYFKKFATTPITKAGIMIYVAGNETNESKIARVETEDVAALTDGKASALFTGIAAANFGKEVIAKAYVVVGGEYVYSDAVLVDVAYAKWLGPKA